MSLLNTKQITLRISKFSLFKCFYAAEKLFIPNGFTKIANNYSNGLLSFAIYYFLTAGQRRSVWDSSKWRYSCCGNIFLQVRRSDTIRPRNMALLCHSRSSLPLLRCDKIPLRIIPCVQCIWDCCWENRITWSAQWDTSLRGFGLGISEGDRTYEFFKKDVI